jgi:hypothetical protein
MTEFTATATKGVTDYNLKIMEIARTNTNTAFEYAQELMRAKSPSDFVGVSTAHARKQFDAMIAQTKELGVLPRRWPPRLPSRSRPVYSRRSTTRLPDATGQGGQGGRPQ